MESPFSVEHMPWLVSKTKRCRLLPGENDFFIEFTVIVPENIK